MIAAIENLIGPTLEAMGFRLVRVQIGSGTAPTLQIMIERWDGGPADPGDGGVTADDCAHISRTVSAILDVADPIPGHYTLEVSSPGIDRPLVCLEDYDRFAGFEAKVETAAPVDGRKRFRGALQGTSSGRVRIALASNGEAVELPFAGIASGKLILTDALVAASLNARERRVREHST
jgi:ribosome maturation factor RimP